MKIVRNGLQILNTNKIHNGKKGIRRNLSSSLATAFIYQHVIYRKTAMFDKSLYQYPIKFTSITANPYIGLTSFHPNIGTPIAFDTAYIATRGNETNKNERGIPEIMVINIVAHRYGVYTTLKTNTEAFLFGSVYQSMNTSGLIDMLHGGVGLNNPSLADPMFRHNTFGVNRPNSASNVNIGRLNTEELSKHRLLINQLDTTVFVIEGDMHHLKNNTTPGRRTFNSNQGTLNGELAYLPLYDGVTLENINGTFTKPEQIRVDRYILTLVLSQKLSSRFNSLQMDKLFEKLNSSIVKLPDDDRVRNIKVKYLGAGPSKDSQRVRSELFSKGFLLLHQSPIGEQYPIEGLTVEMPEELYDTTILNYKFSGTYSNAYYPSDDFFFETEKVLTGLKDDSRETNFSFITDPEHIKWRTASFLSHRIGAGYHNFKFSINNQTYIINNVFIHMFIYSHLGYETNLNSLYKRKIEYGKYNIKDVSSAVTIDNVLPAGEFSTRVIGDLPSSVVTMNYDVNDGSFNYTFHDNTNIVAFELKVKSRIYRFASFKDPNSVINIFHERIVGGVTREIGCGFTDQEGNRYGLRIARATSDIGVIRRIDQNRQSYTPPVVTEITTDNVTVSVDWQINGTSIGHMYSKTITIYPN